MAVGGGDGTLHHAVNAIARCADHAGAAAQRDRQRLLPQPGSGARAGARAGRHRRGTSRQVDVLASTACEWSPSRGSAWCRQRAPGGPPGPAWPCRPIVRAFGSLAYLGAAGARLLFKPRLARHATVRWRDARRRLATGRRAVLRHVPGLPAHARGGFPAAADVAPDDGRFEIVLVEKALGCRWRCTCQAAQRPPGAARHPVDPSRGTAEIEWPDGTSIVGDGEDLGEATSVEARLLPGPSGSWWETEDCR